MVIDNYYCNCNNGRMNWTKIIKELIDAEYSQDRIAALCGTGQSYISGLYRGERKCPNYDLGNAILNLHRKVMRTRKLSPELTDKAA